MAFNTPFQARYFNNSFNRQSRQFVASPSTPRNPFSPGNAVHALRSPITHEDVDDQPLDDFDRKLLTESLNHHGSLERLSLQNYNQEPAVPVNSPILPSSGRHGLDCRFLEVTPGSHLARSGNDRGNGILSSSDTNPLSSPTRALSLSRARSQLHEQRGYQRERVDPMVNPKIQTHHDGSSYFSASTPQSSNRGIDSSLYVQGIRLVPVSELPDRFKAMYPFPVFNAVQSKCFATAYQTNDNLVVSAPTGSGKTVIMELAILRIAHELKEGNCKAVYQAPTKSLCNERFRDWQSRFSSLNIECAELTGDTEFNNLRNVAGASIIVTTPEKWDSITRKWKDNAKLMEMIKLFLIDEVHILKDKRGATLEAVVSRMKSVGSGVRFIALSATVPNSDDVAKWLTLSDGARDQPAIREVFDDSFRPVLLEKHVLSYSGSSNAFAFDASLTEKVPRIVAEYSKRKPVMIFCPTKESAQRTAKKLAEVWQDTPRANQAWDQPQRYVSVEDDRLRELIPCGTAFHHASLHPSDRQAVEQGFMQGNINIICSTSTLAMGVNLPCYLVIIKGTSGYSDNGLQEYSSLEMTQMLGRAGRPQFEREARALIICHDTVKVKYHKMMAGEDILESSLHKNLIEHLNAEIEIGTITSVESAKQWLAGTFLQVRLQRNPCYYGFEPQLRSLAADDALKELCVRDLQLLQAASLVEDDGHLRCTEYGDAMARYYVQFETMKMFIALASKAKVSDILAALSEAVEFKDYRMRGGERGLFKDVNKMNEIRFPFTADITTPRHKVSLLIQAKLGGVQLDKVNKSRAGGSHIRQAQIETAAIIGHCMRLVRCLTDVVVHKNDSVSAKNALELTRSLAAGVWDNTVMQLKQIPGIGDVFTRKLAAAGIKTIDTLANAEPHRIELILSKNPPFGRNILKEAASYPQLHISIKEVDRRRKPQKGVELKLRCEAGFLNQPPPSKFKNRYFNILFLCETSSGAVVDFHRYSPRRLADGVEVLLTALVEVPATTITCHVMCDDIAGTHRSAELQPNIPLSWLPAQTPVKSVEVGQATGQPQMAKPEPALSNFGLDDVDDLDLLEAAKDWARADQVSNIDDLLADGSFDAPTKNKSAQPKTSTDKGMHSGEPRESTQLLNGKWECQHTCREKRIACKHKCCAEGVKRPTKRRKVEPEAARTRSPTQVNEAKPSNATTAGFNQGFKQRAKIPMVQKASPNMDLGETEGSDRVSPGLRPSRVWIGQNGEKTTTTGISQAHLPTILASVEREQGKSDELLHDVGGMNVEQKDTSMQDTRFSPPSWFPTKQRIPHNFRDDGFDDVWSESDSRLLADSCERVEEAATGTVAKWTNKTGAASGQSFSGSVYQSRFFNAEYLAKQEAKKQEHREEQKRRWAKLPGWLYEQFGDIVDIVDDGQ